MLEHDAVGLDAGAAARAPAGAHVRLRGTPTPVMQAAPSLLDALPHASARLPLDNFTYAIDAGTDGMVWITSPSAHTGGTTAIISGTVIAHAQMPGYAARPLTIVRLESWTTPVLFR